MYHSAHGATGRLHQHQAEAEAAQQGLTAGLHYAEHRKLFRDSFFPRHKADGG